MFPELELDYEIDINCNSQFVEPIANASKPVNSAMSISAGLDFYSGQPVGFYYEPVAIEQSAYVISI